LVLYHYASCWYCAQVRAAINELGLEIEMRDILTDPANRQTLLENGGSSTVPCLRIEQPDGSANWMYESADICQYLKEKFSG
ncbi:MAG: glutathione S-transferase N-terminal domain-containing protein, partial [Pseudomonadota bacterium]